MGVTPKVHVHPVIYFYFLSFQIHTLEKQFLVKEIP